MSYQYISCDRIIVLDTSIKLRSAVVLTLPSKSSPVTSRDLSTHFSLSFECLPSSTNAAPMTSDTDFHDIECNAVYYLISWMCYMNQGTLNRRIYKSLLTPSHKTSPFRRMATTCGENLPSLAARTQFGIGACRPHKGDNLACELLTTPSNYLSTLLFYSTSVPNAAILHTSRSEPPLSWWQQSCHSGKSSRERRCRN